MIVTVAANPSAALSGAPASAASPLSPALPAREQTERLLLAVSEDEHREFFGPEISHFFQSGGIPCRHVVPARQTPVQWRGILEEYRPSILVSCWSTPRVPDVIAEDTRSGLRYVCHVTGSVRFVVPRSFLERGGLVSNWGGQASEPVAEHALLLALSCLRNQAGWRAFIARQARPETRSWHSIPGVGTQTLFGRKVGLHGFGRIARALVRLLQPFGVEIRAWSEGVPAGLMQAQGVTPAASLADLFAGSEVLFECEALTERTEKSVTASLLAALPDGAVFVNVGRGRVVDEGALCREAARGRIRIGLDVVAKEPVGPDSPLLSLPNVIFSPHIGGPTSDRLRHCGREALANIKNYLAGQPVKNRVTLEIYDRST